MSHPTPPEPLLGSAWLLAQSPSSSSSSSPAPSRTEITPSTCLSFTHFKTLLDSSRRVSDDAITTRLNRASALSGSAVQGRGGVMGPSECEGVWRELCARWDERRKAIEFCDGVVEAERERLGRGKEEGVEEEKRLSADWKERGRGLVDELEFKLAIPLEKRQAASASTATASSVQSSSPAAASSSASTSVPFYSAPNTFTPTATGQTAAPGSVITLTNSAGAGSYTDTFVYTAAATTVPPTGNVTNPAIPAASGGAGGVTDLQPNPTNLQIAAAPPRLSTSSLATTIGIAAAIALATTVGAGNVLA
ncbi:hypothetical protein JCM10296v2_001504 [Rhodotorula toruloides]